MTYIIPRVLHDSDTRLEVVNRHVTLDTNGDRRQLIRSEAAVLLRVMKKNSRFQRS